MNTPVLSVRSVETLLVGTFDVAGFQRAVRGFDEERIANLTDALYLVVAEAVTGAAVARGPLRYVRRRAYSFASNSGSVGSISNPSGNGGRAGSPSASRTRGCW